MVTVSSCMTWWCMRRSPSAFTVASWRGLSPMIERVRVILSFLLGTRGLLHHVALAAAPPRRVQVLQPLDPAQGVDGRLQDVVRVVRAERLGEDVLHPRRLEHRPHGAAGDDAGAG